MGGGLTETYNMYSSIGGSLTETYNLYSSYDETYGGSSESNSLDRLLSVLKQKSSEAKQRTTNKLQPVYGGASRR